jgi:hypothetical protein
VDDGDDNVEEVKNRKINNSVIIINYNYYKYFLSYKTTL